MAGRSKGTNEDDGLDREDVTRRLPAREAKSFASRRLWLRVLAGPDSGALLSTRAERTTVGTHRTCDCRLDDDSVSRFHCELLVNEHGTRIRDLASRNGTFVDGVRVDSAWLRVGSVITAGQSQLRLERDDDQIELPVSEHTRFGSMLGGSLAMRRVFDVLERASRSDATILLSGETGTGKEVAAESIHLQSERRDAPYLVVDCSAIPAELLESELFGHERGAFTGAVSRRVGAFEAARGGTVFLDEIGELPLEMQPKLLRVLEKREFKRVGSTRYEPADVRVIAATNRDLKADVNARTFRSDLYYRLAVLEVHLPPLRERTEDIPMLVSELVSRRGGGSDLAFLESSEFLGGLTRHPWPGNVRELRNHIERCIALREALGPPRDASAMNEGASRADEGMPTVDARRPYRESRDAWVRTFETRYLEELLKLHGGNVSAAAKAADIDRVQLYRLLWRYGMR